MAKQMEEQAKAIKPISERNNGNRKLEQTKECLNNEPLNQQTNAQVSERTDGWTNEQKNERRKERQKERTKESMSKHYQ